MKIDVTDTMGWLEYEVTIACTPDELDQLRLALSLAKAYGVNVTVIDAFLEASEV